MAVKAFHSLVKISADSQGNAPKTIELLRVGKWETPWHGDFEITPEDIQQFVANAKAGVGLVAADPKIPVNYGHASYDKAAAWISNVYASEDGQALLGDPDWTPTAEQAIKDGEWKYISPEFNPSSCPWEDPEEEFHFVKNVITGAALTNIPLFKKLKPITASRLPNQPPSGQTVKADATGDSEDKPSKGESMDLAKLRTKKADELSDEEKAFVTEHAAELTDDERTALGVEAPVDPSDDTEDEEEEDGGAPVEASAKPVQITASQLARLEADAKAGREASQRLAEKEATDFVDGAIKAGRVKSGERENTVKMLLASKGDQRTQLEKFINGLPVNADINTEHGEGGGTAKSAIDTVMEKAHEAVKADASGKTNINQAVLQVLKADKSLAEEFEKERKS